MFLSGFGWVGVTRHRVHSLLQEVIDYVVASCVNSDTLRPFEVRLGTERVALAGVQVNDTAAYVCGRTQRAAIETAFHEAHIPVKPTRSAKQQVRSEGYPFDDPFTTF